MQRVEIKNRSFSDIIFLTLLESVMLNIILRVFIKKMSDFVIQKETIRIMTSQNKSLRSVYNLAEKARRINLKIQKLFEQKMKIKKLQFYKNLAQRNLIKSQIEALQAFYHTFENARSKNE